VKLFSKKSESEILRTLDEKEIQKRLYGKYHREEVPSSPNNHSNVTATLPRLEIPKVSKPVPFSERLKSFFAYVQDLFSPFLKAFPWRFTGIVIGGLVLAVFLLQGLSFWFSKMKSTPHYTRHIARATKGERAIRKVNVKPVEPKKETFRSEAPKKKVESRTESSAVLPIAIPAPPLSPVQAEESLKKKYYSVQVCTYQREQDAQQLTEELKRMGLPAFYLRFLSSQQQIPHYVVFLGKEETYSGANARLKEFRKTQQFQKFPDSFIRSVS